MIIHNLTIKTVRERVLIKDLSFTLNKVDRLAVIGEEGNGKSTLLKAIYNKQLVEDYALVSGQISFNEESLGYLPQALEEKWYESSIIDFLLKNDSDDEITLDSFNDLQEYQEILSRMHLRDDFLERNQAMNTLSGGEKIKVQLAKIIKNNPDVLLLDEPTNDLDIDTLEWLEEFLLTLDAAIIFISHDETLLRRVANRILHLEQLKRKTEPFIRMESLDYQSYVEKRGYLIERQNMLARKEKQEFDSKMTRWRQLYQKVDHQLGTATRQDPHAAQLLKKKMRNVQAVKKRLEATELTEKMEPEEAINLSFNKANSIASGQTVLDFKLAELRRDNIILARNIDLFIRGSQKVMIIGRNGIGKTTLLKEILSCFTGQKRFRFGYMPQNYEELMQGGENVVQWIAESQQKEKLTTVRLLLGNLKFTSEEMEKNLDDLSGGQRAKAFLAKFVYHDAEVLLLDEPTRNLSPLSNPVIRGILNDFKGAVIAITHDRLLIEEVATQIYELSEDGLQELKRI